jgi:hypothetical protein
MTNSSANLTGNRKNQANNGIHGFMKSLRSHFNKYYFEDYYVGSIYNDDNTITYFPFTPKELKEHKLKIAIVYNYQKSVFEIWLAAQNKQIQKKYWEIFKNSDWNKYHIPQSTAEGYSIVDDVLIENPNLEDDTLIEHIESRSLRFIRDILEVFK